MTAALFIMLILGAPPAFTEVAIDAAEYQLYDLGVADSDGDGDLDIWTANHTAEQSFLVNDGLGHFAPANPTLVPEMDHDFPGLADGDEAPIERPGLHLWWQDRRLHGRFNDPDADLRLTITPQRGIIDQEFDDRPLDVPAVLSHQAITLEAGGSHTWSMRPTLLAAPVVIEIGDTFPLDNVWVGRAGAHPEHHVFTLQLKDRHDHAWADVNGDGLTDLFIARGGLRGEIENHPEIRDELLLRTPGSGWQDVTIEAGLEKHGCRARQAEWIDYDNDGLLDLWITGEDSPNLLYRNVKPTVVASIPRFEETAADLGLRDMENGATVWFDADADGDADLFLAGANDLILFRNDREAGGFERTVIAKNPGAPARRGQGRFGFGRPCAGDFDGDGDLDLFVGSPIASTLLSNDEGTLRAVEPGEWGLPNSCLDAAWEDADGDGDLDLHAVPEGLFLQDAEGRFAASGILKLEIDETVTEARTIWFDMDGDGDSDALISTIGRDRERGHHVGAIKLFRNDGVD